MWLSCVALGAEVDIDAGGRARAGDVAISPSAGLSVVVPKGRTGTADGQTLAVMSTDGLGAQAVLWMDRTQTLQGASSTAQQGFSLGMASFVAAGPPKTRGTVMEVVLEGQTMGDPMVARAYVRTGFTGGTLTLLVYGQPADQASVDGVYAALTGSLTVRGDPSPARAAKGPWAHRLAGQQIRQASTRGGMSHSLLVDLCVDGRAYAYQGGSYSTAGGGVSGASSGGSQGSWSIAGDVITTAWPDGSTDSRTLSLGPQGELLLDGDRWLRQDSKACR